MKTGKLVRDEKEMADVGRKRKEREKKRERERIKEKRRKNPHKQTG